MNVVFENFSKNSKELLTDLINKTCSTTFTPAQVIVGTPVALVGALNTEVQINTTGTGFIGKSKITYNRLDLGILFQGIEITAPFGAYPTTGDLLLHINQTYNLGLSASDVIVENIVWSDTRKFTVKANPTSLVWIGQVDVTLAAAPVAGKPLITDVYPNLDVEGAARVHTLALDWTVSTVTYFIDVGEAVISPIGATARGYADSSRAGIGSSFGSTSTGELFPMNGKLLATDNYFLDECWWTINPEFTYLFLRLADYGPAEAVMLSPLLMPLEVTIDGKVFAYDSVLEDEWVRYSLSDTLPTSLYKYVTFGAAKITEIIPCMDYV